MLSIVEFDVEQKVEQQVSLERARQAMAEGRFVWFDLDTTDVRQAEQVLDELDLDLIAEDVKDDMLSAMPETRYNTFDDYLQLVLAACAWKDGELEQVRVDVIIGRTFLLTAHRAQVQFLAEVRRRYHADFVEFAATPSFLLYEVWDALIENYAAVQKQVEDSVRTVQANLMGEVDEEVFRAIANLSAQILRFRNVLVPARTVLAELAHRRTHFISEVTQTYLGNMVAEIERELADLVVDRDTLANALNLHLLMVGHRTNRVMTRLTLVSMVFLPLTFLVGIYGMNFETMPELGWRYGYLFFWLLAVLIITFALWLVHRLRLV